MNLSEEEASAFLSIVTPAFAIGNLLGGILIGFTNDFNTKNFQRICMLLLLLTGSFHFIENKWAIAFARFGSGFFGKFVDGISNWWTYELCLPKDNTRFINSQMFAAVLPGLIITIISLFDNGGKIYWRLIVALPLVIVLVLLILDVLFAWEVNSFSYQIKKIGYFKTVESMKSLYGEDSAKYLARETNTNLKQGQNSKKRGFFEVMRIFKEESKLNIIFALFTCLSFLTIYYDYSVNMIARDLNDQERVRKAKISIFLGFLIEVFIHSLNTFMKINKFKKRLHLIGTFFVSIGFFVVALGSLFNSFTLTLLSPIIFNIGTASIFSVYFSYSIDILPPILIGIPHVLMGTFQVIFGIVYPLIFKPSSPNSRFVIGFFLMGCFGLVSTLILKIVMIETNGKNKRQIYKELRKLK